MATAILDLDLNSLPCDITGLDNYQKALILIRWNQKPVGQLLLPVVNGCISTTQLPDKLIKASGNSFWQEWLNQLLEWKPIPTNVSPLAKASVAICTRDRPKDLERCLNTLLKMPDDGQEILVIDNCPTTDATEQLVKNHYPQVRYVYEPRPGLDIARNRALKEAKYNLVAFSDDDAAPDPDWLRSLLRNFNDPTVMCVTGLTMPLELETEAQEWFESYSPFNKGFLRRVFESSSQNPLATGKVGAGANMALRRSVVEKLGPFDEALDAGTPTCSGGDHEFFGRILAAGYHIVYEPNALSWHRHRRTRKELRQTLYGYGVGVYSLLTAHLLKRELSVFQIALGWFWHDQLPNLWRSLLRRPEAIPLDLILAELWGCVVGPWAYLFSRRKLQQALREKNWSKTHANH